MLKSSSFFFRLLTLGNWFAGSRDSTVRLWSIGGDTFDPIVTKTNHSDKVRDVQGCLQQEVWHNSSLLAFSSKCSYNWFPFIGAGHCNFKCWSNLQDVGCSRNGSGESWCCRHHGFKSRAAGKLDVPDSYESPRLSFTFQIMSVKCPDPKELVCLAVSHPLVAVGSQRFITFVDMRCGHIAKSVASADEAWGMIQCQRTC